MSDNDPALYKERAFCIEGPVRTFVTTTAATAGALRGLNTKLCSLEYPWVTAIWIFAFYPSRSGTTGTHLRLYRRPPA